MKPIGRPVNMTASKHEAAWAQTMRDAANSYHAARAIGADAAAQRARRKAEAARVCASFWKGR